MIKVAGYGRMSTDKQQLSPKVQTDKVEQWFKYQETTGRWKDGARFAGMFIDEATSSRIDMLDREYGQHLLTFLDPGDIIVVASLTRAFRSAADAERTMYILEEAGLSMVFLDTDVDTSTPTGKVVIAILAACAKFERDMLSERTRDALAAKRRRGEPICPAPVGWKIAKIAGTTKFKPDLTQRKIALAARRLLRLGKSRDEVWSEMGYSLRSKGMKPRSPQWYVSAAAAACINFPTQSNSYVSGLLGINVDTIQFVRRDDHDELLKSLRKQLKQEGIVNA